MANSEVAKVSRVLAPLERFVELTRELVSNLKEVNGMGVNTSILLPGIHSQEIAEWKETEGKKILATIVAPVEDLVAEQLKPGTALVPSFLEEQGKHISSLGAQLLFLARKVKNTTPETPVLTKRRRHKALAHKVYDEKTRKDAVSFMKKHGVTQAHKKFGIAVPTLYDWTKKAAAMQQHTTKVKAAALGS